MRRIRTRKIGMRRISLSLLMLSLVALVGGSRGLTAQSPGNTIPPAALGAHTVAIVNETRNSDVEKGAEAALRDWGQLRLVDDPNTADVTLRFEKTSTHDGASSQKTDANGNPTDYSYSVSFSSKIHMQALLRNADTAFYTTTTGDAKQKAGVTCVNALRSAYRNAHQR